MLAPAHEAAGIVTGQWCTGTPSTAPTQVKTALQRLPLVTCAGHISQCSCLIVHITPTPQLIATLLM